MPRRKKKERNSSELPRLQFVESPSDQSPRRLSPEFGAINPITARTVAIDDIHDLPWVTPQFGDRAHRYRQCADQSSRRSTRLRGSKSSDSRHHDSKSSNVSSKYRPLSFVRNCITTRIRQRHVGSLQNDNVCASDVLTSHNSNLKRNDFVDEEDEATPSDDLTDTDRDSFTFPESFRISTPVIIAIQNNPGGDNSQSVAGRLSVHHNNNHKHHNDDEECENFNSSNISPRCDNKDGVRLKRKCDSDSNRSKDSHELSAVFGKAKTTPCLLDLICSSSSSPPPSPEVLVADTPECDYDLTFRQRQMKYLLRSRPR